MGVVVVWVALRRRLVLGLGRHDGCDIARGGKNDFLRFGVNEVSKT